MRTALVFALLLAASSHGVRATPALEAELVLAGGSLALCSSLSPSACRDGEAPAGRTAALYAADAFRIDAAAGLAATWSEGAGVAVRTALEPLASEAGTQGLRRGRVEAAITSGCTDTPCDWSRLDDHQREGLLAALELPQRDPSGDRLRERVSLLASREQGGVEVIRRFVEAARRRSEGKAPRIAFVTASGFDPYDAVDYYTSLFTEAGATAVWWPLDAALASLVSSGEDCALLGERQRALLGLPDRSPVFPDLVAEQLAWCRAPGRRELPGGIHGVFFAGGDQWRLRRAFFDAADTPYPWLLALRRQHAAGALVVGGTSAGTAVQSGPGMLSNGSPEVALARGPEQAVPPTPGCSRAGTCGALGEDAFTVWPKGGFGLAGAFLMDTHFSERAREWRLLRALAAGPASAGLGVDETSAVHLRQRGERWTLESVGASGAWLFEAGDRRCGQLSGRAHYLAPGRAVDWLPLGGLVQPRRDGPNVRESAPMPALPMEAPSTAKGPFDRGAVRAGIAGLALGLPRWEIEAAASRLQLVRSDATESWTGHGRYPGVAFLDFTFDFPERCRDGD